MLLSQVNVGSVAICIGVMTGHTACVVHDPPGASSAPTAHEPDSDALPLLVILIREPLVFVTVINGDGLANVIVVSVTEPPAALLNSYGPAALTAVIKESPPATDSIVAPATSPTDMSRLKPPLCLLRHATAANNAASTPMPTIVSPGTAVGGGTAATGLYPSAIWQERDASCAQLAEAANAAMTGTNRAARNSRLPLNLLVIFIFRNSYQSWSFDINQKND